MTDHYPTLTNTTGNESIAYLKMSKPLPVSLAEAPSAAFVVVVRHRLIRPAVWRLPSGQGTPFKSYTRAFMD